MRQGRTDAWIAHQLEVSASELREFRRRHELNAEDETDETDLRDEIEAEIEAATREEELAAENADDDDDAGSDAESDSDDDSDVLILSEYHGALILAESDGESDPEFTEHVTPLGLAEGIDREFIDFDEDGFADLAIGAPGEGLGSAFGAGAVHVLYGSGTGLTDTRDQLFHQDSAGIAGAERATIAGAGHLASLERQEETARLVREFLQR